MLIWRSASLADAPVDVPVDPDRADAHPGGGHDVVHPAIGDVHPGGGRRAGKLGEPPEVPEVGLVPAHLLGRHHEVKRHREPGGGGGEQVVVAVREDRQLPPGGGERRQRRAGIGEDRQPRPPGDERGLGPWGKAHARPPGRHSQPRGQDLPVREPAGPGFQDQLRLVIGGEQGLAPIPGDRGESRRTAGIPVRDRAVAVKRQPPVAGHRHLPIGMCDYGNSRLLEMTCETRQIPRRDGWRRSGLVRKGEDEPFSLPPRSRQCRRSSR